MISMDCHIMLLDLQDRFFTIPIHPDNCIRFALALPFLNNVHPHRQYQWVVLPQGMMNSPTLCQIYASSILQPIRQQYSQLLKFSFYGRYLVRFSRGRYSWSHSNRNNQSFLLCMALLFLPIKCKNTVLFIIQDKLQCQSNHPGCFKYAEIISKCLIKNF